jgi:cellulose synthase/poly-beta-1,6-N-acetylglucosamine synthase-like glycosyltransferase
LSRFEDEKVAAVQGYQHHDLNDSETWVTRGARVNYTAWQLTDFPARSVLRTFIPLGGSAMIVRRNVLEEVGMFSPTIAEDWDLSVKIHLKGYRVLYDDSIRVSAECPSLLRQWLRQQMRWAEGTTILFRKYARQVWKSPNMGRQAKMNYLMDVSIYLQTVPMLMVSAILASRVFLPSLTAAALPYYVALPLLVYLGAVPFTSGIIGFHRDGATRKLYWLPLGLLLTYIAMPFAAYSSFKGFVQNKATFSVTKKTGSETRRNESAQVAQ